MIKTHCFASISKFKGEVIMVYYMIHIDLYNNIYIVWLTITCIRDYQICFNVKHIIKHPSIQITL